MSIRIAAASTGNWSYQATEVPDEPPVASLWKLRTSATLLGSATLLEPSLFSSSATSADMKKPIKTRRMNTHFFKFELKYPAHNQDAGGAPHQYDCKSGYHQNKIKKNSLSDKGTDSSSS